MTFIPILTLLLLLPTIGVRAEEADTTAEEASAGQNIFYDIKGDMGNRYLGVCIEFLSETVLSLLTHCDHVIACNVSLIPRSRRSLGYAIQSKKPTTTPTPHPPNG